MNINISGQQINIGSYLQQEVKENIESLIKKYFDIPIGATVHFSKDGGYLYECEIILNKGTGNSELVNAHAKDRDIFHSFSLALSLISKQLRKYKSKLKDHHRSDSEQKNMFAETKKYTISPTHDSASEDAVDNPIIIAEKDTPILFLTVGEAVMRMELLNLRALVFKNRSNDRINVVYQREDGNIAWIDPK